MRIDRERLLRDLTFWLRPDFVVRCLRRFEAIRGFDRGIALASVAFTALIPLMIIAGSLFNGTRDAGTRVIDRLDLEGKGAEAIRDLFDTSSSIESGSSLFSVFLLLIALLSFSRAIQRLLEQTWELSPLSVRNTANGLAWIGGLVVYLGATGFVRAAVDGPVAVTLIALALLPVSALFTIWSGRLLTGKRVTTRQMLPAAVLVAVLFVLFGVASDLYAPHLFNSYASRYGAIGGVFALISWLFAAMVVLVAAMAAGREIWAEMEAIRRGDRPSNEQIEAEWLALRAQMGQGRAEAATRTAAVRERLRRNRPKV